MNDKKIAINLFISKTNLNFKDIKKIKEIHLGYTNKSFLFILKNGNKYQVRLGKNNNIVDRSIESKISSILYKNIFLYIGSDGNAIKKWIDGYNPKFIFNKKKLLKKLIEAIHKLHSVQCYDLDIKKQDYLEFIDDFTKKIVSEKWINLYLSILEKHKGLKLVFSHNDINPLNMIYERKTKEIILIDYEWARLNNEYWDVANFFRETNLKIKWLKYMCSIYPDMDFNILLEFCFVCSFFAHLWSLKMTETKKIKNYRKRNLKKLNYFYSLISN